MIDVSVVIPTYNRAALLAETINAVLVQTVQPREIVVVDNGTDGDTAQMIVRYGERVRYSRTAPLGVGAARNTGARLAQASWIALLDDDDILHPEYFEHAEPVLADGRASVIFTDHRKWRHGIFDERSNFDRAPDGYWTDIERPQPGEFWSLVGAFPLSRLLRFIAFYAGSMMIVRKDLYDRIGGFDPRVSSLVAEDIEFLVRVLSAGKLAIIWKPLVDYRIHPGSHSFGAQRQAIGRWQVFEYVRARHTALDPELREALDDDLPRRRARIFDLGFLAGDEELMAAAGSTLARGDWTVKRWIARTIAGAPHPVSRTLRRALVGA